MPNITVTYVANGNPSIQVYPSNQNVGIGESVITWNSTNCHFSPNTGVVFAPTVGTPAVWPGDQPAYDAATGNYTVTDRNPGRATTQYNYNISVKTSGGSRHTRLDPDITNTP